MSEKKSFSGFIKSSWAGVLLALAVAFLCWESVNRIFVFNGNKVLDVIGAPVFAILIGMLLNFIFNHTKLKNSLPIFTPGIKFTSKKVLQFAVILLGFGMNLATVAEVGAQSLPIILSTIATSLILAFLFYKLLKIPSKTATLIGVGSSICGGSAIAATAPVIEASDEEVAQSISVIFLFNVIAALIFPTLGGLLGMGDYSFGVFAGTAVNDMSSVQAAASTWDSLHGTNVASETATVVKMTRTLAIIVITLALAVYRMIKMKKAGGEGKLNFSFKKVFPFFILFFILASVITTVTYAIAGEGTQAYATAKSVFSLINTHSKFFIVMAMAAIGFNTDIVKLVKTGGKPILLGFVCWVGITGVSLLMQFVMGIWVK